MPSRAIVSTVSQYHIDLGEELAFVVFLTRIFALWATTQHIDIQALVIAGPFEGRKETGQPLLTVSTKYLLELFVEVSKLNISWISVSKSRGKRRNLWICDVLHDIHCSDRESPQQAVNESIDSLVAPDKRSLHSW